MAYEIWLYFHVSCPDIHTDILTLWYRKGPKSAYCSKNLSTGGVEARAFGDSFNKWITLLLTVFCSSSIFSHLVCFVGYCGGLCILLCSNSIVMTEDFVIVIHSQIWLYCWAILGIYHAVLVIDPSQTVKQLRHAAVYIHFVAYQTTER